MTSAEQLDHGGKHACMAGFGGDGGGMQVVLRVIPAGLGLERRRECSGEADTWRHCRIPHVRAAAAAVHAAQRWLRISGGPGGVWTRTVLPQSFFNARLPCALLAYSTRPYPCMCRLLPLARALRSPALKLRHWTRLSSLLRCTVAPDDDKSLAALADIALPHLAKIGTLVAQAEEELALEQQLDSLQVRMAALHACKRNRDWVHRSI